MALLGRLRPAVTTLATIYTVPANARARVRGIYIMNDTTSRVEYQVDLKKSGIASTALDTVIYGVMSAKSDRIIEMLSAALELDDAGDELKFKISVATTLTITVFGDELGA